MTMRIMVGLLLSFMFGVAFASTSGVVMAQQPSDTIHCTLFGGFATESARWFFDLGDGTQIPVQMPAQRPSLQSSDGRYTFTIDMVPSDLTFYYLYSLSIHDSQTGETRFIADHVDTWVMDWAPLSNRFAFLQVSSSNGQVDGYTLNLMSPDAETPQTILLPADEADLRVVGAGVAWSPDESMIAVAYGYQPTQVKIFAADGLREIQTFDVLEGETQLLWSPTGSYLTAIHLTDGLETFSLYRVSTGEVISIQSDYRSYRRLSWSPDESYLVEFGTQNDFSSVMSIFTAAGERIIDNLVVTSADDGGSAIYGWLDDHTLIVGLDHSTQELSQVDVLTGETQPLVGAELHADRCEE